MDAQRYQDNNTWEDFGHGDNVSLSSESLSPIVSEYVWASVRAFLVPADVLCTRTTAGKWNVAGLYGPLPNSASSS